MWGHVEQIRSRNLLFIEKHKQHRQKAHYFGASDIHMGWTQLHRAR